MQSSTAVMFRALVMLACLVAIPLAAVMGKSLPDVARGLLRGEWSWRSAPTGGGLDEAPPFAPTGGGPGEAPTFTPTGTAPPFVEGSLANGAPQPSLTDPWATSSQGAGSSGLVDSAVVRASNESFVPPRPEAAPIGWPIADDVRSRPDVAGAAVGPGAAMPPATPAPLAAASDPRSLGRMAVGEFASIESRLRQLGATYYMLESWGDQEQLYRFYCRVAVEGNANFTRYFEATHFEPLAAMSQVLEQVEAWRASTAAPSDGWSLEPRQSPTPVFRGPS